MEVKRLNTPPEKWYGLSPRERQWVLKKYVVYATDWHYLWGFKFFDWFQKLAPKKKSIFLSEIGERRFGIDDLDRIGNKISLIWMSENITISEHYRGSKEDQILIVDCSQANAWGYMRDRLEQGRNYILICPTHCPQIPRSAISIAETPEQYDPEDEWYR